MSVSDPTVGDNAAWGRCSRLFAVCAGLLCVVLLIVIIILSVKLNHMTREKDQLLISCDNMTTKRERLYTRRDVQKMLGKQLALPICHIILHQLYQLTNYPII